MTFDPARQLEWSLFIWMLLILSLVVIGLSGFIHSFFNHLWHRDKPIKKLKPLGQGWVFTYYDDEGNELQSYNALGEKVEKAQGEK